MPEIQRSLITYCTNIHQGESWEDTFSALRENIPAVKSAVSPDVSFPIGLRLSNLASSVLTEAENNLFREWLQENNCFIPTINGFPYGSFHGERIKEKVYLPDWRSPERTAYTIRLADLLSTWLPDNITGSISTVPLGFKEATAESDFPGIINQLETVLTRLARIHDQNGREILLALEPEPGCLLETTSEVCRFFSDIRLPENLRKHLAICYDTCHQAVEFENPSESLKMLAGAGVRIAKFQISSALKVTDPAPHLLHPYAETEYLHQVVIRRSDDTIVRYDDLPHALTEHKGKPGDEWRCHFHVPIFLEEYSGVSTTRCFLQELLPHLHPGTLMEVETYTWNVLPPELRCGSVTGSIIREISWLKEQIDASNRST